MIAPILADEILRLRALKDYEVLDTPEEEQFQNLATLAAEICQMPIALISLVDESRQWFKAKVGIAVDQTPREMAFCAHALGSSDLLLVSDASTDIRFADNPLVTGDPHIRAYAGAPLIAPGGNVLGTLCVIDRVPRHLN